jgi:hypothetical protein
MKLLLLIIFILFTLAGPIYLLVSGQIDFSADYRTANRESAHLAPAPGTTREAVIQAYAARAFNWRGVFATHNWIAVKTKDSDDYIVYQVVGWRLYRGFPALMMEKDIPDRYWFNQKPHVILDIRGEQAEKLIPKIHAAAKSYPYPNQYDVWPGPNSNTLPAYIARQVPELRLALPSNAIGKDFLFGYRFFAKAPSGTGYQFSLFGFLGVLLAKNEGFEINILGMVYGIRFTPFAILLPGIGAIPQ